MNIGTVKSVETEIVDYVVDQLKSYSLKYVCENGSIDVIIDGALTNYASKSGGAGENRPDANMCSWAKIKDIEIQLPISNSKLDLKFMESFIAELEFYLEAAGLKNTVLTKEETSALEKLKKNLIEWKEWNVNELFSIKNTHCNLSRDVIPNSGSVPYLCASAKNNSVSSYIEYDETQKENGNCIFIGGKTFVVSYQSHDFFSNDSHNLALYANESEQMKNSVQFFLAAAIERGLGWRYSWGDSISFKKIQTDTIRLPVTASGEPDYSLMTYIVKAVRKIVETDVVAFADRRVAATKKIINRKQ